jgi:hypothetical protein
MKKIKEEMKATMYREGSGWIVSYWSKTYGMFCLSNPMQYNQARAFCGKENKK